MKTRIIVVFFVSLILTNCKKGEPGQESELSNEWRYVPVTNVPVAVALDSFNLKLEAYLWRNFMPLIPPGGPPLISLIYLTETMGKDITGKFELLSIKIVADKIWVPTYTEKVISTEKFKIGRQSNDGPQIEPGRFVDVICEIRYLKTGKIYDIMASKQKIERAD